METKKAQEKYTQHILKFLEERPYISMATLERAAGIADGAIRLAKSAGRLIPENAIFPLLCELSKCGITDIYGFELTYHPDTHVITGRRFVEEYKTVEILNMKDGTKLERETTDEMYDPDGWEDPLSGEYSGSSFLYYDKYDKMIYTDFYDLI